MSLTRVTIQANRRSILLLCILLAIYLVGRLFLLMRLPPFIDEGLHSYYVNAMEGGIISAGAGDGKWLSILLFYGLTRLATDMLLVIRLASVTAGALTMVAIFLIGRDLYDNRTGLLSALFYIFLPYALFYNRLGLTDGIAIAFGAWTLLVSIRAVRSENGLYSVLLTALLLASVLAKASAMIFILFPVLALLFLTPRPLWLAGLQKIAPAVLGATAIVVVMLSQDMGTAEIVHKTVETRSAGVFELIARNTATAAGWFWSLLTPLLALLALVAILSLIIWRRGRPVWFLLAVLATVLAPYIASATIWYPRYLLFALVPLALLLGVFWDWITETIAGATSLRRGGMISAMLLTLLLIWPALFGLRFMISPEQADLPTIVRRQYVSAWTAGYGVRELAGFLAEEARATPESLLVLRPDHLSQVNHGGLELFMPDDAQLELETIGEDLDREIQLATTRLSAGQRTFFVFDSTQSTSRELAEAIALNTTANQIWRHIKPWATGGLEVWELTLKG